MQEDYFLYYEELDWVMRGKRKKIPVRICGSSKVFHKQGTTTGKKMEASLTPFTACLHHRNFLLFYKRFFPMLYPVAVARLFAKSINCFLKGQKTEAKILFKVILGFKNCSVYQK